MISFQNVSKQFFNNTFGVRDVSFEVNPGEMLILTGPTGSGKTTLMRLLTKEYDPSEGEILFENTPLSSIKSSQLHHHRRRIGVIFQDYRLLPEFNVWENIALPLSIAGQSEAKIEERITDLLKLIHLEEKAELFPRELSGGEQQRVSIARALSTAPPVIFADEPTGNLDPDTSQSIVKLLRKINELGTTVLVATHDVVVMDLTKEIRQIHLEDGRLTKDTAKSKAKAKIKDSKSAKEEASPTEDADENEKDKADKQTTRGFLGIFGKKRPKSESANTNQSSDASDDTQSTETEETNDDLQSTETEEEKD